jgi:hypothetical protein
MSATGHLADTLAARFGSEEVFRDIETIAAGDDFRNALNAAVQSAQVMLVVIGRSWTRLHGSTSPSRLLEHGDYVRMEIEAALAQDLPIIPVLVERARMPAADDLPESLRAVAYRQALELSHSRWRYDTERLVRHLTRYGLVPRTPATASAWSLDARGLMSAFARLPSDFLGLLYEPRRLLTLRGSGSVEDVVQAGIFLFVTQVIGGLLVLQVWPTRSHFVDFLLAGPILALIVAFVLSVPMYWAWRIAGAGREYRRVFAIVLYQCSFVGLCTSLATTVMLVAMEMALPDAVEAFAGNPTTEGASVLLATLQATPAAAAPWVVASLLIGLLLVGMLIWLARTWRAYRLALGQSPLRSWAALAIFAALCGIPVSALIWAALVVS